MISLTKGNLLEADVDALVNTVNTSGVMGKGIALMFKEKFPANFDAYARACRNREVTIGKMFVTERTGIFGPRWIINFPTKTHWRVKTRMHWVQEGLQDLVRIIKEKDIRSVAVPPLGCGNGGLEWREVKPLIIAALEQVDCVDAIVYEPTTRYQNVVKRTGVEKLTPARALIAELIRRYCVTGLDCSLIEVQKLGWFVERAVHRLGTEDPLRFDFSPSWYGPYSHRLTKLLDSLDGSYLRCDRRLADAGPIDHIWFNASKKEVVRAYLGSGEGRTFADALEWSSRVIQGFESPLGMEVLATVDWLVERDGVRPETSHVLESLGNWRGGEGSGRRKRKIFNRRLIGLALDRLSEADRSFAGPRRELGPRPSSPRPRT